MILPYDRERGIIMISYSDNRFADEWNRLYMKKGIEAVNQKLKTCIEDVVGKRIPMPKHTQVFYWNCGVGYWGVGADSESIEERLTKPFEKMNLFLCGEHYSSGNQQWMEGALETTEALLTILSSC
jgi:hypothetical protein